MIVVADSSPLRYLVLIQHVEVLPVLYQRVLIPPAVEQELTHQNTPAIVKQWMSSRPSWLEAHSVQPAGTTVVTGDVDIGEEQAILLAKQISARYILIDDHAGRAAARQLELSVVGTLGVLQQAGAKGLLDFPSALARLESTNFRLSPHLRDIIRQGRQ